MKRKPVEIGTSTVELLSIMAEGDPEANEIVGPKLFSGDGVFALLHADDMNIRGPQFGWALAACEGDETLMWERILNRDRTLLDAVNARAAANGYGEVAVQGGASKPLDMGGMR